MGIQPLINRSTILSIFKNPHKTVSYKENKFIKKERKLYSVYIEIEPNLDTAKSGYSIRFFNENVSKNWESYLYRNGNEQIDLKDKGITYKAIIEIRAKSKEELQKRIEQTLKNNHDETIVSYNPNKQSSLSRIAKKSVGISARRETTLIPS